METDESDQISVTAIEADLIPLAPEDYAAEDSFFIGDDGYIRAGVDGDLFGVAAADVEVVPVEGGGGLRDGVFEEAVPRLLAEFVETAAAEVVLVGFALPGMMAEFEAGA